MLNVSVEYKLKGAQWIFDGKPFTGKIEKKMDTDYSDLVPGGLSGAYEGERKRLASEAMQQSVEEAEDDDAALDAIMDGIVDKPLGSPGKKTKASHPSSEPDPGDISD